MRRRERGGDRLRRPDAWLVVLDENDEVIRPAILWNDGRTAKQVEQLNDGLGREKLSADRQHRLRRLHRAEALVDAGERAGKLS